MSEKMTAKQARTFEHGYSQVHAAILANAALEKGCQCVPYVDWFTYKRWLAQGFQVQKGEHGIRLVRFITAEKDGKKRTFPKRYSVFCRCQVKEIEK